MKDNLSYLSEKYETEEFLIGDPSWFMHQVTGESNQELLAFIAASLSYGSRKQFMPKIQYILDCSGGNVREWLVSGNFKSDIPRTDKCFYRLYTCATMHDMLCALQELVLAYGSLKAFVGKCTCYEAIEKIVGYFSKRDLGLWSDIIDKRTLIMPRDTHGLQEANRLGLLKSKTATMATAMKLTESLRALFPEDPLKGDFALFGVGVDEAK